ncbi:hypothetical protein VUR80DRAFT_7276 [Thermomyces stellatus]
MKDTQSPSSIVQKSLMSPVADATETPITDIAEYSTGVGMRFGVNTGNLESTSYYSTMTVNPARRQPSTSFAG